MAEFDYEVVNGRKIRVRPVETVSEFEDVVKLDTAYIKDWSIGKDLRILAKTVQVVLMGKGSM